MKKLLILIPLVVAMVAVGCGEKQDIGDAAKPPPAGATTPGAPAGGGPSGAPAQTATPSNN